MKQINRITANGLVALLAFMQPVITTRIPLIGSGNGSANAQDEPRNQIQLEEIAAINYDNLQGLSEKDFKDMVGKKANELPLPNMNNIDYVVYGGEVYLGPHCQRSARHITLTPLAYFMLQFRPYIIASQQNPKRDDESEQQYNARISEIAKQPDIIAAAKESLRTEMSRLYKDMQNESFMRPLNPELPNEEDYLPGTVTLGVTFNEPIEFATIELDADGGYLPEAPASYSREKAESVRVTFSLVDEDRNLIELKKADVIAVKDRGKYLIWIARGADDALPKGKYEVKCELMVPAEGSEKNNVNIYSARILGLPLK